MMRKFAVRLMIALLFGCALSSVASACTVCAVGREEARGAYYATTALMTLVPLLGIGGLAYYISKKSR